MPRAGQPTSRIENGKRVKAVTGEAMESSNGAVNSSIPSPSAAPTSLTTANLKPQPDMKLASPTAPTKAAGLEGAIATQADQFTKDLEQRRKQTEADKDRSFDDLTSAFDEIEGKTKLTDRAYGKAGGADDKEAVLNGINKQLLQESEALRRSVERIQTAPGTATAGERDRAVSETTRVSLRKQADLAILQIGAQGDYKLAKEIADRAVAMELEEQEQEIETLKFIYAENKDLFSKAEQREYETVVRERERVFANTEYRLRAEYDQKIKQADPLYQLQLQKTRKEISLMGQPSSADLKALIAAQKEAAASVPVMQDKLTAIGLLKEHSGKSSRIGPNPLARGPQGFFGTVGRFLSVAGIPGLADAAADTATGSGQAFAGGVHKLTAGLSIDSLLQSKAQGATWGALSDNELRILSNAGSAISDWEIKDKEGNPTGFWDVDEGTFNKELDTIKALTQRALVQSGQSLITDEESSALDDAYQETASPASYFD